jgi:tRNA pseudouridine38-40 synthase
MGAGRTDTGVHASQMYAHFDFDCIDNKQLVHKLNSIYQDIVIYDVFFLCMTRHTRFDATRRDL